MLSVACFIHSNLYGQKISASVNRSRIFIGEKISLKLSVEQAQMGIHWFQFEDTMNHLEVTGRSKIDTVQSGGFMNFYQTVSLTSFDSGRWQFPALAVAGINQITMPIIIDVVPVDVSQKKDYNDIKDIEEVLLKTNPVLIATLVFLTLFSLFMIIILVLKKRKGMVPAMILKGNETPLEWALEQLNKLQQPDTSSLPEAKKYYGELNIISRKFFVMQWQQNNRQLTTDEWMVNLQQIEMDAVYKTPFYQFLRLADSVRFAKFLPPVQENETAKQTVKTMLQKAALLPADIYSTYQPKQS